MNKTLIIFFVFIIMGTIALAFLSNGIFVEQQESPVTQVEKKHIDKSDTMSIKNKEKNFYIYKDNRIEEGHYTHYNEELKKEWEINFDLMKVETNNQLGIDHPLCIYYSSSPTSDDEYKIAQKYKIIADKAIAKKQKDSFSMLHFIGNVEIYGYDKNDSVVSKANTNSLDVDLVNKEIFTDDSIAMSHLQDVKITSSGIRIKTATNMVEFLRNVDLSIRTEDKNQKEYHIESSCQGKLLLQKIKKNVLYFEQHQKVVTSSAQAKMKSELVKIEIERANNKIFINQLSAFDNVYFEDNQNILTCDTFYQDSSHRSTEKIILQGKSSILVKGDFSLLAGEEGQKFKELKDKKRIKEMRVSADSKIKWTKTYDNLFVLENIILEKNAQVSQTTEDAQNIIFAGDYIQFDLVITAMGTEDKEKREPVYLESKGNAYYQDKDIYAKSDVFSWKKLTQTKDKLNLQGQDNLVKLFQVETSNLEEKKSLKVEKKLEDIWIHTNSYLEVTRDFYESKKYICQAVKNVHIDRVVSKKKIGSFDCQSFTLEVYETETKKMNLDNAIAKEDVVYKDESFAASGNLLTWKKDQTGKEIITLSQKKPAIFIQNLKMTNIMPGEEEKPQSLESEDVKIITNDTIVIERISHLESYHCQAFYNVEVFRYATRTSINTGKFTANYIELDITKQKNNKASSYDLKKLTAKKDVYIQDGKNVATGQHLVVTKDDIGQNIELSLTATVKNDKAQISADKISFNTNTNMFSAQNNVILLSEKAEGKGDFLTYNTTNGEAILLGNLAHFIQMPANENKISAQKIIFQRNSNRAFAFGHVVLEFSSKSNLSFDGKKSESNKLKQYLLNCSEAEVIFTSSPHKIDNPNEKINFIDKTLPGGNFDLSEFTAKNNVVLQNKENNLEKITGNELHYDNTLKKITLLGCPGYVYYDDNQIESNKFEFLTEQKEAIIHGPSEMYLAAKNMKKNDAMGTVKLSNNSKIKVNCAGEILYLNENRIKLSKNIVVLFEEKILQSQKMDIVLEKGVMQEIIAYDQVVLISGQNKAYGSQLRWNEKQQQILITDYPHVVFKGGGTTVNVPILYYHLEEERFYTKGRNITAEKEPVQK